MLLLNKFLPLFVLPFGWVCLLVIFALWRKKIWPAVVALVLLYVASIPFVSDRLLGLLEARYPEISVEQAGPADIVVVLGGILGPKTSANTEVSWGDSVERFQAGVALMQAGRAGQLVFTGARRYWFDHYTTEGAELRRFAIARGVPAEKIVVTSSIYNTATEAAAVAELMRTEGKRRAIIVTSAFHMPRSVLLFQRAGVECLPFPVDFRLERTRPLTALDFIPSGGSWAATELALRECYGYAFYRVFR